MTQPLLALLTATALGTALLTGTAVADPTPSPSVPPVVIPTPTPSPSPSPTPAPTPEAVNKTIIIGHSVKGTPLYAYRRNAINPNRRVLVIGNIHGDEPAGVQVARYLRDHADGYHFRRDVEVWIILSINPDGLALHTRQNANHVDLNRNFDYQWERGDEGTQYYSGPRVASEPETKALAAFDRAFHPKTEIIFHQPYGVVDLSNSTAAASKLMSQSISLPVKALGTRHGSNAGYLQQTVKGSIAMTVEFASNAPQARLNGAINGTYRVANSR